MPAHDVLRRMYGVPVLVLVLLLTTNACTEAPKDPSNIEAKSPGENLPMIPNPINATLRGTLLKAIEKYLEKDPSQLESNYLAAEHPELSPKTFCSVEMVELRGDGSTYLAGVYSQCHELARKGEKMVTGTAFSVPQVARLEMRNSTPQLISIEEPRDGTDFLPSLRKMFTEENVRKFFDEKVGVSNEEIYAEARKTFHLPADAKVIDIGS